MSDLRDELRCYQQEHAFLRSILPPAEDANRLGLPWAGGFRWFRSENVVCLEQARLLRAKTKTKPVTRHDGPA
jgi:hypothetical protein